MGLNNLLIKNKCNIQPGRGVNITLVLLVNIFDSYQRLSFSMSLKYL